MGFCRKTAGWRQMQGLSYNEGRTVESERWSIFELVRRASNRVRPESLRSPTIPLNIFAAPRRVGIQDA